MSQRNNDVENFILNISNILLGIARQQPETNHLLSALNGAQQAQQSTPTNQNVHQNPGGGGYTYWCPRTSHSTFKSITKGYTSGNANISPVDGNNAITITTAADAHAAADAIATIPPIVNTSAATNSPSSIWFFYQTV